MAEEKKEMWFVFETEAGGWGMDKATKYTVNRHNYFYGTREECHKWCSTHDLKLTTNHTTCYDRLVNEYENLKANSLPFNNKKEMVILKNLLQNELNKTTREEDYLYEDEIILNNLLSRINTRLYDKEG